MKTIDVKKIVCPHILKMKAYSSARLEYEGKEGAFLDANENSLGSVTDTLHNRYPDPLQTELKIEIAKTESLRPTQLFLGNGSDECIGVLVQSYCIPAQDKIMVLPPSFAMYEHAAHVMNIGIIEVLLKEENFQMNVEDMLKIIQQEEHLKIIFICSPNNPTANLINENDIETIKALFDQYVRNEGYKSDEKYKGEKTDSLITELIFDYCRLFSEDFFTGKKAENLPVGEGKLYKVRNQGEIREIQIGEFIDGKLTGEGKIIKNSIIEKEGAFKNGELNGKGTIINFGGRMKIMGTFVDNQLTGEGEVHHSTGAYEKGQYLKSRLTGEGERHLQNGNFYKGTFKDGKYNGWGTYHWGEQNIDYEGDFENGKRNGSYTEKKQQAQP